MMESAILTCAKSLALVTLLPTMLTRLMEARCLETLAGNVGRMSLPLIGCTLAI